MRTQEDGQLVVNALKQVGINVADVYDLVNSRSSYPQAIPVLLTLLPRLQDLKIKEGVIRALTVREARGAGVAEALIAEFSCSSSELLRWTIGNALSVVADDAVFGQVVELAREKKYGRAREMVVEAMANMKDPRAAEVLIDLLDDEDTAGHAIVALGRLGAVTARPRLEPFLNHSKAWIRREARQALKRIDRCEQRRSRSIEPTEN